MLLYTLAQIKDQIKDDLDLNAELFISDTELNTYVNRAIDRAEQEILKINEDYFLDFEALSIVADTAEYNLPAGIYAQKIRSVVYTSGSIIYNIPRLKPWKKFLEKELLDTYLTGQRDVYKYMIRSDNSSLTAPVYKFVLSPAAQETSSNIIIWYQRNASRLTSDTHVCDIPEALNFILAYVRKECLMKEFGGIAPPQASQAVEHEVELLVNTLTEAQPDNDNEIEPDRAHYLEHN